MKKLATLLLAAGMVVASSAPASAIDVKADGFYRFTFETKSDGFNGVNKETVAQRMRLGLTITASENLKGYTQFQMGTNQWGDYVTDQGTGAGKHGHKDVQVRQMYVDWKVPAAPVTVRMGRHQFGLPTDALGGNSVLGAGWGGRDGIVVNAKAADWLGITALWNRAGYESNGSIHDDKFADMFGLAANLKFDGISGSVWAAYSTIDGGMKKAAAHNADGNWVTDTVAGATGFTQNGDTNDNDTKLDSDSYYFGATVALTYFDPFKLVVSGAYGVREYDAATGAAAPEDRKGWNVQAKASYGLGFGTPVLAAWYASGDDADDKTQKAGWLPSICGYNAPTTSFFDGATSLGSNLGRQFISGTWGVQAGIEGMSFLQDLTHEVKVTWIQGTNNVKHADTTATYMTTSDSVVELALNTDYNIYKNLVATLELAYLIADYDENIGDRAAKDVLDEDDWRIGLTMTYKF